MGHWISHVVRSCGLGILSPWCFPLHESLCATPSARPACSVPGTRAQPCQAWRVSEGQPQGFEAQEIRRVPATISLRPETAITPGSARRRFFQLLAEPGWWHWRV